VNNELHTVHSWFTQRSGMDDGRESESIVRLVFDRVSGMTRMDRLTAPWRASESDLERLALLADRLKGGEPVQYALGETSFAGLMFQCDRRALIPRPETEELLMEALRRVQTMTGDTPLRVLDVGTGSGILPIAWKSHRPTDEVHGLDLQAEALELATANAELLGCAVDFHCIDILQQQPAGGIFSAPFDVILSNPPYIPQADGSEMLPNVLDWEPPSALFVEDGDPLLFYRRIIDGCGTEGWLKAGGLLAVECHRDATEQVADLIPDNWSGKERLRDLQGNWRMVFARS
jgi:release factor glutamine methyltransferase